MLGLQRSTQIGKLSPKFKLKRSRQNEAVVPTKATQNYKVNLTGNPNSCMVNIQKHRVRTLLDTGSQCCLMSANFYQSLKHKPVLKKCNANLQSVDSGNLKTLGKVHLNFEIKSLKLSYDFFVVEGINRCLIF